MAKVVCNFLSYSLNCAVDITVVLPSVTCPEALGMGDGQPPTCWRPSSRWSTCCTALPYAKARSAA